MTDDNESNRPWYREPWVWVIIAIPGITILWSVFLILFSMQQHVSMVEDDYYDKGTGINRELSRDIKAADLGLTGRVSFTDQQRLDIVLKSPERRNWERLEVELSHATLGDRDQTTIAERVGEGRYRASINALSDGRWYIDIRNIGNDWRLRSALNTPLEEPLTLKPIREARQQ
ncbi:FixH family protein [Salicola sp. Rm-C-2C1-2]|uniref:FixH family protein n=1 Tax=Salicola sp. Rm-C-2C1-2 TaxID=3141321 RepID=UPI0032E45C9E